MVFNAEYIGLNIKDPNYLDNAISYDINDSLLRDFKIYDYNRKKIQYNQLGTLFLLGIDPDIKFKSSRDKSFEEIMEG